MARQEVHGFTGSVTLGTGLKIGIDVTGFSAAIEIDQVEIPPAFGSKWKKTVPGAGKVTGTLRGNLVWDDTGTMPFDPDNVGTGGVNWTNFIGTVTLTSATGCTITGTMFFHNVSIDRGNGQLGTIQAQFVNNDDDVDVTWDETA